MGKYLFSSIVECSLCHKKYKIIKERNKIKLICSSYQNKKCERNIIEEEKLLYFIKIYCDKNKINFNPTPLFIQQHIKKIIALPNSSFEIYYKDGTIQCYKDNKIKLI